MLWVWKLLVAMGIEGGTPHKWDFKVRAVGSQTEALPKNPKLAISHMTPITLRPTPSQLQHHSPGQL